MAKSTLKIVDWLKLPEARDAKEIDDPLVTEARRKVIWEKVFLRRLYIDFYQEFKKIQDEFGQGIFVELGSGAGFLKKITPDVITSDILPVSGVDVSFSALNMPFKDNSVRAFFMLNVFHHVKDSFLFLQEMKRCLKLNGRIIMIEPANTPWGRFVYQNFHHENFNPLGDWMIDGTGPLSSANGALSWIVFSRDRLKFAQKFPSFEITRYKQHTPVRYLISGGVSMRQLLPSFSYSFIKGIEAALSPLNRFTGMFSTIEITKIL